MDSPDEGLEPEEGETFRLKAVKTDALPTELTDPQVTRLSNNVGKICI